MQIFSYFRTVILTLRCFGIVFVILFLIHLIVQLDRTAPLRRVRFGFESRLGLVSSIRVADFFNLIRYCIQYYFI